MKIGFHTDAFNSAYFSFEKCLQWAQTNGVHHIECGMIDGVSWIHGLGYQPHVALYEDPILLRRKMTSYGVQFSQVDAAYPLSGKDGAAGSRRDHRTTQTLRCDRRCPVSGRGGSPSCGRSGHG